MQAVRVARVKVRKTAAPSSVADVLSPGSSKNDAKDARDLEYGPQLRRSGAVRHRRSSAGWTPRSAKWAVEHRTPALDNVTHLGSMMADTFVALAVTAVAVVVLRLWLGRWRESLATVVSIVGELLIFLAITATVHRARPEVPQLDHAAPASSFHPDTVERPSRCMGASRSFCCASSHLVGSPRDEGLPVDPGAGHHPGHRLLHQTLGSDRPIFHEYGNTHF